jgi:hypothetical protein
MSATVTPDVPVVETTPHAAIVAAQTPLDVVNAALNNPALMAVFQKYAGNPNGIPATLAGLVVGGLVSHYALQMDPATVGTISLVVAGAFGYGWNWLSAKYLTPATPVTQGTSHA